MGMGPFQNVPVTDVVSQHSNIKIEVVHQGNVINMIEFF